MRFQDWKWKFKVFVITRTVAWLVRLWFGTVRVKIADPEIFNAYFKNNRQTGNVVAGTWHRHAIFFFYYFRKLNNAAVMISQSKDGDFAAGVARRFGYSVIRGSSSKGGRQALEGMIDFMSSGREATICGTPVDGPRGPARQLKKGMLVLASQANAFFVPMACSGKRVITFHKAWDKTILPLPFGKMTMTFGQPVKIPANLSETEMEAWRRDMEKVLDQITDRADELSGYDSNTA